MSDDFDLRTLHNFSPARYLCQRCLGLLTIGPYVARGNPKCPVCSVEYVPSETFPRYAVERYLDTHGLRLTFDDLLEHCKQLAAATIPDLIWDEPPPMRMLLQVFSQAKQFVHFVSFGIADFFIGALKVVAQRVKVRGIVSNIGEERVLDELTAFQEDVPSGHFEIMHFLRDGSWKEAPHQKLIVVDGLIAFKGSANLTLSGWRKAAKGLDHVEIVTKVNEVVDLHNRLFSPVWAQRTPPVPVKMDTTPFAG